MSEIHLKIDTLAACQSRSGKKDVLELISVRTGIYLFVEKWEEMLRDVTCKACLRAASYDASEVLAETYYLLEQATALKAQAHALLYRLGGENDRQS